MASIFKRSKAKGEPYTIKYLDHLGKRRTRKGFTDKGLTEKLAKKLEGEARLKSTGLVDPAQEALALTKLSPIEKCLIEFEKDLDDNSEKHIKLTMYRIRQITNGCSFDKLGEIQPETVRDYLRTQRKTKKRFGHRTYNHYLQALDSFLNWCVSTKRLAINPIVGMERLNIETDVRHPRRALSPEEVATLLKALKRVEGRSNVNRQKCVFGSTRVPILLDYGSKNWRALHHRVSSSMTHAPH